MNDNVHLLRSVLAWGGVDDLIGHNLHERAGDALSELEAENQQLRDALGEIALVTDYTRDIARSALDGTPSAAE